MTDQIREQLSALLDGELPKDEMGLLVRRLEKDAALRRTFGTYALIGETLRAPGGRIARTDFAARVSAAIDASDRVAPPASVPGEQAAVAGSDILPPQSRAAGTAAAGVPVVRSVAFWQRPMVRTAMAASAAAAAVLLFRPDANTPVVAEAGPQGATAVSLVNSSPAPAQSQRLASYMVAHSQYSTPLVRRNVLTSLLAADPGITRVSYEMGEAP